MNKLTEWHLADNIVSHIITNNQSTELYLDEYSQQIFEYYQEHTKPLAE